MVKYFYVYENFWFKKYFQIEKKVYMNIVGTKQQSTRKYKLQDHKFLDFPKYFSLKDFWRYLIFFIKILTYRIYRIMQENQSTDIIQNMVN